MTKRNVLLVWYIEILQIFVTLFLTNILYHAYLSFFSVDFMNRNLPLKIDINTLVSQVFIKQFCPLMIALYLILFLCILLINLMCFKHVVSVNCKLKLVLCCIKHSFMRASFYLPAIIFLFRSSFILQEVSLLTDTVRECSIICKEEVELVLVNRDVSSIVFK